MILSGQFSYLSHTPSEWYANLTTSSVELYWCYKNNSAVLQALGEPVTGLRGAGNTK